MYELYQSTSGSRGSMAEVWINRESKLVKKFYKPDGCTITGNPPRHTDLDEIKFLYETEIFWSTKLQSKYTVRMLDHGEIQKEPGWFIVQDWHGSDLLPYFHPNTRLYHIIPDADKQIEEMFEFWKSNGVYKINNAMANMTMHNGRILAFDFKYAEHRADNRMHLEQASIQKWVSKIEPSLVDRLERLL